MSHVMGQSQSGTEVKDEFKKSRSQQQEPLVDDGASPEGFVAPFRTLAILVQITAGRQDR